MTSDGQDVAEFESAPDVHASELATLMIPQIVVEDKARLGGGGGEYELFVDDALEGRAQCGSDEWHGAGEGDHLVEVALSELDDSACSAGAHGAVLVPSDC